MSKTVWSADPAELLRVWPGFQLADVDTSSTPGIRANKTAGRTLLAANAAELEQLQERLFAESTVGAPRSLLLVLQGTDTSGKGGIVQHVIGGMSAEGVHAVGFKRPSPEELEHDFLWRVRRRLPAPGMIGVFDRSHYEDVLIARVRNLAEPRVIDRRYGLINDFERDLVASGMTIVKVMLHISAKEQKARLAARLAYPSTQWKYNPSDIDERDLWPKYQQAYQLALERTSTTDAPWFVVPADKKWYARIAVQRILLDALRRLKLDWPTPDYDLQQQKKRVAAS
ncbi:MAG: PPK2 family polyphosphate kinase [Lacisediminihabitans sp.]